MSNTKTKVITTKLEDKKDYYQKNKDKLKKYSLDRYRKMKELNTTSLSRWKNYKQFTKLKY